MRALTGLKQAGMAAQRNGEGRAPEMPLKQIHSDPNNVRRPEDEHSPEGIDEQNELTEDIKRRGVKSPVSLRPHPTIAGEFILNYGHRRLQGAIAAGLETIPYFIDVSFDCYDQVKENLLHRKPSVWALAAFVQRKLSEGQSKAAISQGLGKSNQNLVTELQALADAPACLHLAYANGVRSPRTLYDLRRAYDEYPEQTEAWCAGAEKITRDTIRDFMTQASEALLKGEAADQVNDDMDELRLASTVLLQENQSVMESSAKLRHDVESASSLEELSAQPDMVPLLQENQSLMRSASKLRHDVKSERFLEDLHELPNTLPVHQVNQALAQSSAKLRHDVKTSGSQDESSPSVASLKPVQPREGIIVEYLGKSARIAANATVLIVLDGDSSVLSVPLVDITFVKRL